MTTLYVSRQTALFQAAMKEATQVRPGLQVLVPPTKERKTFDDALKRAQSACPPGYIWSRGARRSGMTMRAAIETARAHLLRNQPCPKLPTKGTKQWLCLPDP